MTTDAIWMSNRRTWAKVVTATPRTALCASSCGAGADVMPSSVGAGQAEQRYSGMLLPRRPDRVTIDVCRT